jgi:hypothetical protein
MPIVGPRQCLDRRHGALAALAVYNFAQQQFLIAGQISLMKTLTAIFFALLLGSLVAMWARGNGIVWANQVAILLGLACGFVGIGLFISQVFSNSSTDVKKK